MPITKDMVVQYIRVDRILPNLRLCYSEEAIDNLSSLVCSRGDCEPIMVFFDGDHFRIVDGEKRWRACKRLGMTFLRVVITETHYTF